MKDAIYLRIVELVKSSMEKLLKDKFDDIPEVDEIYDALAGIENLLSQLNREGDPAND